VWWQYIIIAAVILLGIYGFLTLTSFETRVLSRRTSRRAADLYPRYADSLRKQRRYAIEHGGEWTSSDGGYSREPEDAQPREQGEAASGGPASGPLSLSNTRLGVPAGP
jgi:hypothetical protein